MLQVCNAASEPNEAQSFCNTWLDHLHVQLPNLAVAIDDSLMALVERCVKSCATSTESPLERSYQAKNRQVTGRAAANSPGAGSWTPSATSPMTLLEQARQAKKLNEALDSFGASRNTGE